MYPSPSFPPTSAYIQGFTISYIIHPNSLPTSPPNVTPGHPTHFLKIKQSESWFNLLLFPLSILHVYQTDVHHSRTCQALSWHEVVSSSWKGFFIELLNPSQMWSLLWRSSGVSWQKLRDSVMLQLGIETWVQILGPPITFQMNSLCFLSLTIKIGPIVPTSQTSSNN